MSSIIPGYTYDIFISYRQKDHKGYRWVSEFVDDPNRLPEAKTLPDLLTRSVTIILK